MFSLGHALVIGVGTYHHAPDLDVPITIADAEAVAGVLTDPACCGYPTSQVQLLCGAAASRSGVLEALDGLATRAGDDAMVFLFYAGHGAYGDEGYFLTAHDTRFLDGRVINGSGISVAELIGSLRLIKAKRVLLIVNACHAGELSPVLEASGEPFIGTPLPSEAASALLFTGEGRVIITACRDKQVSYIGPGPLTLFTQALVDCLQGNAVLSNSDYISVFDLYTHIDSALGEAVKQVPASIRERFGHNQVPEITVLKGAGPFVLAPRRVIAKKGRHVAREGPVVTVFGDVAGRDIVKTSYPTGRSVDLQLGAKGEMICDLESLPSSTSQNTRARERLQLLIKQLRAELQKVPVEKKSDAEAVYSAAVAAVAQASKAPPEIAQAHIRATWLQSAARSLPEVLPIIKEITETIFRITGSR